MADKAISELVSAEQITATDMFVLEQNGTAKKLTGQILLNWLTKAADGHGGIKSIEKINAGMGVNSLVDTYRITLADTTTFDFMVSNGRGVTKIEKTASEGLVDIYTIEYNDGATDEFRVANGAKGDKGDNAYLWIKYASQEPTDSSHSFGDLPDEWIGIYFGGADTAPTDWRQYKWFKIKGEKGDTGDPATLVSSQITYQAGDSGTIIPSGNWLTTIPSVAQGKFLWTRQILRFNTGDPVTTYSVARFGIDGSGAVSSVAGVSPDSDGNVPLTADDVRALPTSGGNMTGAINMNGQKITGLNAPTQSNEVATKGYVDNAKPNLTGYATETYVNNSVGRKVDISSVVNNFTTTEEGYVADARTVNVLNNTKLSMELLWENADASSEIAAHNMAVDWVSEYDIYFFVFRNTTTSANKTIAMCRRGDSMSVQSMLNLSSSVAVEFVQRIVTVSTNGYIGFSDATGKNASGDAKTNNKRLIPIEIYGLKGVIE